MHFHLQEPDVCRVLLCNILYSEQKVHGQHVQDYGWSVCRTYGRRWIPVHHVCITRGLWWITWSNVVTRFDYLIRIIWQFHITFCTYLNLHLTKCPSINHDYLPSFHLELKTYPVHIFLHFSAIWKFYLYFYA